MDRWKLSAASTLFLKEGGRVRAADLLKLAIKELILEGTWTLEKAERPRRLRGPEAVVLLVPGDRPPPGRVPLGLAHSLGDHARAAEDPEDASLHRGPLQPGARRLGDRGRRARARGVPPARGGARLAARLEGRDGQGARERSGAGAARAGRRERHRLRRRKLRRRFRFLVRRRLRRCL